jgi:PAT family acetyl-CoA transporter-like MFS transporter 1
MGLREDAKPVVFLLFLYFLQGVPLGLSASIPLLLQKYGVSYTQQAIYTISGYPFSFKVIF